MRLSRTESVAGVASTTNVWALLRTCTPAAMRRFNATNASFCRLSISRYCGCDGTVLGDGFTFQSVTFSNGPVNGSRILSNRTPIWNASVQPALS